MDRRMMLKGISASAAVATAASAAQPAAGPVVETAAGRVRGYVDRGVSVFKGVPYGAPPVGPLRFMPPRKPAAWKGVREALTPGLRAMQSNPSPPPPRPGAPSVSVPDTSPEGEDCLVLNVWTPGVNDGRRRPVMFWCHGGGFVSGSGSGPMEDGTELARRGDVVVVAPNHRLNVFGYADLGCFGDRRFAHAGNIGMLDLVEALKWVRENIADFGGDPGKVMIFGESGGGQKVCALLAMPAAKGLFHRACMESGPAVYMTERSYSTKVTELLLAEFGLKPAQVGELQAKSAGELLAAYFAVGRKLPPATPGLVYGFSPVVDGRVLPRHPFAPDAPAISADVPVLLGHNRTEMTFFLMNDETLFQLDEAGLRQRLTAVFGDKTDQMIRIYRQANPRATPSDLYFLMVSDRPTRAFLIKIAERRSAQRRAPTFVYQFNFTTPVMGGKLRTPHVSEIPYVFRTLDTPAAKLLVGERPEARALSDKMSDAWIAFARNGDPNAPGLPRWRPYAVPDRTTMLFDVDCRAADDPASEERIAMDRFMFPAG
jgi:para-nitrobenzyl esterase